MKTITNITHPALAVFALACFALLSTAAAAPPTNVSLGPQALQSNTTGTNDTALGYQALRSNTIGSQNTATGTQALYSNTTGSFNTATGDAALFRNTTGNRNTADGYDALFNTTTGLDNTATGFNALLNNTTGGQNTAVGAQALYSNTEGQANTAYGFQALMSNTTGFLNQGFGNGALLSNTTGTRNLAVGNAALIGLTSGDSNTAIGNASLNNSGTVNFNTAVGRRALYRCQGDQNIGLGFFAGSNLNDGSANNIYIGNVGPVPIGPESNIIRIGTQTPSIATVGNPPVESHTLPAHTATFIAGIYRAPVARGLGVVVDSTGHLGTVASSERFKDEIRPMDKTSEAILALKPVTFRYKKEVDPDGIPQFGLVGEEVEKVNPDLVARDDEGKVYTVRYEAVNAMLLNEFLKEHRKVQELEKQVEKLAAGLQKVSAQVEMRRQTPQMVVNNQ
jgi:hypothetical protein